MPDSAIALSQLMLGVTPITYPKETHLRLNRVTVWPFQRSQLDLQGDHLSTEELWPPEKSCRGRVAKM